MTETMNYETIAKSLNSQAAELAVIRLLLNATLRQIPDLRLLRYNFNEMAEDNEVRAMFSSMPEVFFDEFRQHRAVWLELLDDVITSTEGETPSGS